MAHFLNTLSSLLRGKKTEFGGEFRNLKVALISDELTRSCLALECRVRDLTPLNYKLILKIWRPNLLFVESAWQGWNFSWKYKIASYPEHTERTNSQLADVVAYAQELGVPCVFWNKEDGVHFDRFINSAKLFDHIFTVDENCVPRYRAMAGKKSTVNVLMFPVQPEVHNFSGFNFKHHRANFVGSYSHHIHDVRRNWQNILFDAACKTGLGLTIIDRNSERTSSNYRYPPRPEVEILPSVPNKKTANVYKDYLVSLNVNTISDSRTMYSRRLGEILACGGIAITTPSLAVSEFFADFCHVVHDPLEAEQLFDRLKHGPNKDDLERARAGADYVLANHTWNHRLREIAQVVGLE